MNLELDRRLIWTPMSVAIILRWGGGKDIFAHLAHPPTGWIEACEDLWQTFCSVRLEPRSNPK